MNEEYHIPFAVAGISHKDASVEEIEKAGFRDEKEFYSVSREYFRGSILLQTCNRVEIIVEGESEDLNQFLFETGRENFSIYEGSDGLRHLLLVSSGIDSMIVGEDQILGQLKKALENARENGTTTSLLELCVNKSINIGVTARKETNINRGAVSIGSAAVKLAEREIGNLKGRHILVVGSGEMGMLVTQALSEKDLTAIYVANRTYGRACFLADKIGGKAVRMNELDRYLVLSDVVITCTSAPHPVIKKDFIKDIMKKRCWPLEGHPRPLILIDIAQPRDIEEGADLVDGVTLFTIDDLRSINEVTMENRRGAADRVLVMIESELPRLQKLINRKVSDYTVASLYSWAESIRIRERDRALVRIDGSTADYSQILDDLTRSLTKKLLSDITYAIRESTECGDVKTAEIIVNAIIKGEPICFPKRES